jgi:hypothetical protein
MATKKKAKKAGAVRSLKAKKAKAVKGGKAGATDPKNQYLVVKLSDIAVSSV